MGYTVDSSTDLTWATAGFDWSSQDANKTWAVAQSISGTEADAEAISFAEALVQDYAQALADSVAFLDDGVLAKASDLIEAFVLGDDIASDLAQFLDDLFTLIDYNGPLVYSDAAELLFLADALANDFGPAADEAITFIDDLTRVWDAYLEIAETLTLLPDNYRDVSRGDTEAATIFDRSMANSRARYGDILIRNTAMDAAEFARRWDKRGPAGWNDFKPFQPGDYSYRYAMVWLHIDAQPATTDEFSITEGVLHVDVPDQDDRGQASVTSSGGLAVSFNRTFYAAPQVTTTQISGATRVIIVVSSVTSTGFVLDCYDAASPSTKVAATVSWGAKGY